LYLKNRHVVFEVNAFGNKTGALVSRQPLKPGKAHIVLTVVQDASDRTKTVRPGTASLTVNGVRDGETAFLNLRGDSYTETLDIGCDLGSPVSTAYQSPYRFEGTIEAITVQFIN
jgi:arylsulfatase